MAFVIRSQHDRVAVLSLQRGKANALTGEVVEELRAAVEEVAADPASRALVLGSAVPNMFCAGFDVTEVFGYARPQMRQFFAAFAELYMRLRTLPKPVVAALAGPAFAGGAILALACDLRVMADSARFAVNEIDLGVSLPDRIIRAMASCASPELMRSILLAAEVVTAERALAGGLVSAVVPAAEVPSAAIARAKVLGEKPPVAFAAHKRALDLLAPGSLSDAEIDATMDAWFGPESVERRQALIDRLAKKTG